MFLNIILKESNRIESLVTDLLDLSHIEQHTELDTDYMNLSDLTRRIIDNMMTQANQKIFPFILILKKMSLLKHKKVKLLKLSRIC